MNIVKKYLPFANQLETSFDQIFRRPVVFIFYWLSKDYYSKFAKVSLFVLLFFIPLSVGGLTFFFNKVLDALDPVAPELLAAEKRASEQAKQMGMTMD